MRKTTRSAVRVGLGLFLAAAIAACGNQAATGQPTTTGTSPRPAPRTAFPTPADASSPSPQATPSLSQSLPAPDGRSPLVDLLPTSLGGTATQKLELLGSDTSMFDASSAMIFESILTLLGVQGADMQIGIASTTGASIVALRVRAKGAKAVGDAMIAGRALNATTTKEAVDLGGKHAIKVTTTTATVPFYVYAHDDVSFTVAGTDAVAVAEALSKLP